MQAVKSAKVSSAMQYEEGDTIDDYQRKNRARFYKEVPADISKIMIRDYNNETDHEPFSETEDYVELLDRYRKFYKKDFSKKRIMEDFTRDITSETSIDSPSSKQLRKGIN